MQEYESRTSQRLYPRSSLDWHPKQMKTGIAFLQAFAASRGPGRPSVASYRNHE
jgi:hypothetical protein